MESWIAIINADLVGSSALAPEQRAAVHQWLTSLPTALQQQVGLAAGHRVDVFRGDSWQLLVPEPAKVLRIALYQQAWLRSNFGELRMRARQGIGLGRQQLTDDIDLASADGAAFRRAGRALEASYQGSLLRLHGPEALAGYPHASLNEVLVLIDELSARWTSKQSQAILGALAGSTQEQIGDRWPEGPISQQAVGQHLKRSGWDAIEGGLDFFESWLPDLLAGDLE